MKFVNLQTAKKSYIFFINYLISKEIIIKHDQNTELSLKCIAP